MKMVGLNQRIHIMDTDTNVRSVISEIAESDLQEEAFYVCDIGDVIRQYHLWKKTFPQILPYYAVKCNDHPRILEILAALGTGFDCASHTEIDRILSLGVNANRIIFANPTKPNSHLRHAALVNVKTLTFDNKYELEKIKNLHPDAKLVLRLRCDATDVLCQLGVKFGCDPINEAPRLLRYAKSLHLNVIGISFHVGSGCREPAAYRRAIQAAHHCFEMARKIGLNLRLLDIGGGFPGKNRILFEACARTINTALLEYFPDMADVEIIAEPGQFFVGTACTLACNIHSIRDVHVPRPHRMYYINDGMYGSFYCCQFDHRKLFPQPLHRQKNSELISSSIWGQTCDGFDRVVEEVRLPELQLGDWIVFEEMGAYTMVAATNFNGFAIPKVHMVADESIWLFLKDVLGWVDDHFVLENTPNNRRFDLDISGNKILIGDLCNL